MIKYLFTYRYFKILTVIIFTVSIGMPSSVIGSVLCGIDYQQKEVQSHTGDHCTIANFDHTHHHGDEHSANAGLDCVWTNCNFTVEQAENTSGVLPVSTKIIISVPSSIIEYIPMDELIDKRFFDNTSLSLNDTHPPLFVLNSSFLN